MKIEIDQSGKVEYTSTLTIMADSMGNAVSISAKDKRTVQEVYRVMKRPRMFVLHTFSTLVVYLIQMSYKPGNLYVVDKEYPGKESEIKSLILEGTQRLNISLCKDQISFQSVGKKSNAHVTAYNAFRSEGVGKKRISVKQIGAVGL
jgi:hypothetical protein